MTAIMLAGILLGQGAPTKVPDRSCFIETACKIQSKVAPRKKVWTDEQCESIAGAFYDIGEEVGISPELLLAVSINESDLNAKSRLSYERDGKIWAVDVGLMGIRCVLGKSQRCININGQRVTLTQLQDPKENIRLGAEMLKRLRDERVVYVSGGRKETCAHKKHAWWAHYNWGHRVFHVGKHRHYPHRVGTLFHAVTKALGSKPVELQTVGQVSVKDPGRLPRQIDRPVGRRYKELVSVIHGCSGVCGPKTVVMLEEN